MSRKTNVLGNNCPGGGWGVGGVDSVIMNENLSTTNRIMHMLLYANNFSFQLAVTATRNKFVPLAN